MIKCFNEFEYGLGVMFMMKNVDIINIVMCVFKVGMVWVNVYGVFVLFVFFGGYKKSGFGWENGVYVLLMY